MINEMPATRESSAKALDTLMTAFTAADSDRRSREDEWLRWYKLYRSRVERGKGDWRSKVFIPICFYVVETVAPRLIAQLPGFSVYPVGPEDTDGAEQMETALRWAVEQSEAYLQLVQAMKSSLMYGTGVLKTFHMTKQAYTMASTPVTSPITVPRPVLDPESGTPMMDVDNRPVMEDVTLGEIPTGETRRERVPYTYYSGPGTEHVDIWNFWPSPEAADIDSARYVIHRTLQDRAYFEARVREGIYTKPQFLDDDALYAKVEDPRFDRLAKIGLGSAPTDPTWKAVELLEYWTDDQVITVANRRAVVRLDENPFMHGEKPFVRLVDYLIPDEFWGMGEIEVLEGLQDHINALTNQRIDNVRLLLDAMFLVDEDSVTNREELRIRPGGVVGVNNRNGLPLEQVVARINFGDVTSSAYEEVNEAEAMTEKVSGVSAYQLGTDSPSLNRTATGVTLISEQASSRFAHKLKMMELTGLKRLARQFGSIFQQYLEEPQVMRLLGPQGVYDFQRLTPESIQGRFDYDIQSESSAQTESMRKDQALQLYLSLGADPLVNREKLLEDVFRTWGKKNPAEYVMDQQQLMMQQLMMQQQAPTQAEEAAPMQGVP